MFMIRRDFTRQLKEIEQDVTDMGQMVITAITRSVEALKMRNATEAERIVADDALINKKRWEIEERCIDLIATQQPVASDLREIVAILSIITELERMGDYAEGIGKIVLLHGHEPLVKPLIDIPRMAQKSVAMLRGALDAFVNRDAKAAAAVCAEDDEVDLLHEQVYRVLVSYMIEDPKSITRATYLIWVAHNLERTADRVTNICERIIYLVTGKMSEDVNVSRY
jgi:phosphate transport system protein